MVPMLISLCSWWNIVCKIEKGLNDAFRFVMEGVFDIFYAVITELVTIAVKAIVKTVGTMWLSVPNPNIGDAEGHPVPVVEFMQGRIMYLAVVCATVSLIVAGMRMAWTQRGEALRPMFKSLLTFMIVTFLGVALVSVLITLTNEFSNWVIHDPGDGMTFNQRIDKAFDAKFPGKLIFVLTVGIGAILTSIIQIGLMFVRNGMLILLVGVLPLAAAATDTELGKAWFRKICGWIAAFLAYKPVAALIFSASLRMMGADDGNWATAATGVAMMLMSVIALPALIKFVAPATGG
jgi:hypothetical protein